MPDVASQCEYMISTPILDCYYTCFAADVLTLKQRYIPATAAAIFWPVAVMKYAESTNK